MTIRIEYELHTTWSLFQDNQTAIVEENGRINTTAAYGIHGNGHNHTTTIVDGDVTATEAGYSTGSLGGGTTNARLAVTDEGSVTGRFGAVVQGYGASVSNSGRIEGTDFYGVFLDGSYARAENDGVIKGGVSGIYSYGLAPEVTNHGKIVGADYGIRAHAGGTGGGIDIHNSGTLRGDIAAIRLSSTDSSDFITNTGKLVSKSGIAIDGNDAKQHVINNGKITGDVNLEGGHDIFISNRGTVDGLVHGGDGQDFLKGGRRADKFEGGLGDDVIKGGKGDDRLSGGADTDKLLGGKGNDKIKGGTGFDQIEGGKGNDKIKAGASGDIVIGGRGDDHLWGEAGNDVFIFRGRTDDDTIKDFESGLDKIQLIGFGISNFSRFERSAITYDNGKAYIDLDEVGGEGTIVMNGVNDLDAADFIF